MSDRQDDVPTFEENERRWATLAAGGDAVALEQLLIALHPRLLKEIDRSLPRALRPLIEPSDVLQDVYYDAFYNLRSFKYRGQDSAFQWLRTIARHRLIELLRRQRAIKRGGRTIQVDFGKLDSDGSVEWALEQVAIYHRTPSGSAMDHEAAAAVEDAVNRLPASYRHIISLRYFSTLSFGAVAEQLKTTEAAVKMTCGRAIDRLRNDLRVEFQQRVN